MFRIAAARPVKLAVFGLSVAVTSTAFACPRPGGGGYGGGYHRPVHYAQPQYRPAPHTHPQPQPQFAQPSIPPQQMFPNGSAPSQTIHGQLPQGQSFPQGQPLPQQQVATAPQGAQQVPAGAPQQQAQQPIAQQAASQRPQTAPIQATPAQTPATQTPAAADASMTALQILAGMSAPQASSAETASLPPAQPQADPRTGAWVAKLGNGASIRLDLRADGSFLWTATQNGKTSSFEGSYAIAGDSMTLSRSSDNQKLAGKLTDGASGFNFKLDGANDSGLDFVRG